MTNSLCQRPIFVSMTSLLCMKDATLPTTNNVYPIPGQYR